MSTRKESKKQLYKPLKAEFQYDDKHWTRLYDDLLLSKPFKLLSSESKLIYFYIKREYKGSYNKEPDTVCLPYNQITTMSGIPKRKIKACTEELELLGFINIEQRGGLYRLTNYYQFSGRWKSLTDPEIEQALKEIKARKKQKSARTKNPYVEP